MWHFVVGAFTLTLAAAPPAPPATAPAPAVPATTPATTAALRPTTHHGVTFTPVSDRSYQDAVLKPHAGRVLLVNFWASYCLPCLEEMPALLKLKTQLGADVDVVFVSTDDPAMLDKAGRVLSKWKIPVTASFFVEGDDPDPFLAVVDAGWQGAIPHTLIYGRDGAIVRKLPGAQSATTFEESLRAAILASPAAPTTAATPATPAPTTTTK